MSLFDNDSNYRPIYVDDDNSEDNMDVVYRRMRDANKRADPNPADVEEVIRQRSAQFTSSPEIMSICKTELHLYRKIYRYKPKPTYFEETSTPDGWVCTHVVIGGYIIALWGNRVTDEHLIIVASEGKAVFWSLGFEKEIKDDHYEFDSDDSTMAATLLLMVDTGIIPDDEDCEFIKAFVLSVEEDDRDVSEEENEETEDA